MQILRQPALSPAEYGGCVAAFVAALSGELNAASAALGRLAGAAKGSAFAFEIALDRGRYGALMVIDRWRQMNAAFGPHLRGDAQWGEAAQQAETRVTAAETILARANQLLDAAPAYQPEVVEAVGLAFQEVHRIFRAEGELAERAARPGEHDAARAMFQADLARR